MDIEILRSGLDSIETDWQPISSAPRDGQQILLTWFDDGRPQEIWAMQWAHIQRNSLFAPGITGMWTTPDGGLTWTEHDPDGAPTHWMPIPNKDPRP